MAWVFQRCKGDLHEAPAHGAASCNITYIPYRGTFACLSTILDAYTKQILSYVLSDSLEVDFVLETVEKLMQNHGISLTQWTVIHSGQGVHYTSHQFIEITKNKNLRQSMSRKGNCWDNAPQESFFGRMKDHIRDKLKECREFWQVSSLVDGYMDYYNIQKDLVQRNARLSLLCYRLSESGF